MHHDIIELGLASEITKASDEPGTKERAVQGGLCATSTDNISNPSFGCL